MNEPLVGITSTSNEMNAAWACPSGVLHLYRSEFKNFRPSQEAL